MYMIVVLGAGNRVALTHFAETAVDQSKYKKTGPASGRSLLRK